MKKILLVTSGDVELGGVQNFLINWIQSSVEKYQYIWYFCGDVLDKNLYERIQGLGVEIILGKINKHGEKKFYYYRRDIKKILEKYNIDIVHINTGVLMYTFLAVIEAKRKHISKIITHSHSAIKQKGKWREKIAGLLKEYVRRNADVCAACSEEAALALYGKSVLEKDRWFFIKNKIDVKKYQFNRVIRDKIRKELGIKKEILLGNVGQLYPVKNQVFLLEIMRSLKESNFNAKLLIIGTGPMREKLDTLSKKYQLEKDVILLGEKRNVNEWLQAMDIFLMPSLHEGLSIAAVEAQTAGLAAIFNEEFSKEIKLTENVEFIPIDNPRLWVDIIKALSEKQNEEYRKACKDKVIDAGFDVSSLNQIIVDLYK